MKKFKFRLQKVLDYRETVKAEKKRELGLKNRELLEAEQEKQTLLEAHDAQNVNGDDVMRMSELHLSGIYQARLQQAIEEQEVIVAEAVKAVEVARDFYTKAAVDTGALSVLKERRKDEYAYERKRYDGKVNNDLVMQRHNRKMAKK